jgi:osmoprotectant transport system ATP-binding protein
MDEPFGAIDPINRLRLQGEFLRLQQELRKTVVFVTHDIDEAIRIGDRIAVLRDHGVLAQYATPAELLMRPADAFVEDFVGADRALKRLGLTRVGELEQEPAPAAGAAAVSVPASGTLRDALSTLLEHGVERGAVTDGNGHATGAISVAAITRFLAAQAEG